MVTLPVGVITGVSKLAAASLGGCRSLTRGCGHSTGHIVVAPSCRLTALSVIRESSTAVPRVTELSRSKSRTVSYVGGFPSATHSNNVTVGENVITVIQQKAFCAGHGLRRVTAIHAACC